MPDDRILLGVIGRPHGVRGIVHVLSYTDPPAALAGYGVLETEDGRGFTLSWRGEGLAALVQQTAAGPAPLTDRAAAERLTNLRLFVPRARLPAPAAEEYYLADLVGLRAQDVAGTPLGQVVAVHDYGAGASLEIAGPAAAPLLVPFTRAAVPEVDLTAGFVIVAVPAAIDLAGAAADEAPAGEVLSAPAHAARTALVR